MSDAHTLLSAFDDGRLLRPDADATNTVDLARAVALSCGVPLHGTEGNALRIAQTIGEHDHIVLVLVDGLGMHLLNGARGGGFVHSHTVETLRAVFPTSTAPALTTLATGTWPAQHAVTGWHTYLPHAGITATILPFVERFSNEDARRHGARIESSFPSPPILAGMLRQHYRVMPKRIDGSVYSRYSGSNAESFGYVSLREGCDAVVRRILLARGPTLTYVYVPFVDTAQHEHGIDSKATRRAMRLVESRLEEMVRSLSQFDARVVLTADHGQVDIASERQVALRDEDPMLALLRVPPSCEPRTPAFHVREDERDAFELMFRERYGDDFALLSVGELDELRLLGPEAMTEETRARLGDYVGVALGTRTLSLPLDKALIGFHGGLLPDEVLVPLALF